MSKTTQIKLNGKKGWVTDRLRKADTETAAILRAEYLKVKDNPPPKPAAVLAYEAEVRQWKQEKDNLWSKMHQAEAPRYRVTLDRGWCAEVLAEHDSKAEALRLAKEKVK